MARPIDTNMPNINPQVRGAGETAGQLKVDQKLIDKVLSKQGLGSPEQLAKLLGPEVLNYFRAMSESLSNLCSRMQESDIKSLQAQRTEPKLEEFMLRDTSKETVYQKRLPENFLSPEKLNLAVKTGLLKPEQAEALKHLFGLSADAQQMHKEEYFMHAEAPQSEQGRGQGQQQQQNSGQQGQSSEDDWADFSSQEMSGSAPAGNVSAQGLGGASLRSNMRMNLGGPAGSQGGFAPPPPPPPPGSGGFQNPPMGSQAQIPDWTQGEESYLNANFSPGDPYYGSFESLFGSENWYRSMAGTAMSNIQQIRGAKQAILAELAGLDPSKPADAKKLYILQQKLGDMQQSERQWLDNISMAQKANNERKEYIKSILDVFFQTNSAIIRNMKQ